MTINKLMESRNYVKHTINAYSSCVRSTGDTIGNSVRLSIDEAKDVAICLHWLEVIFDSLAESEVSEMKLNSKMFEYRYEY